MSANENTALALVPKSNTISIAAPNIPSMAEIDALNAMCKIAAYSGFLNSTSNDPAKRAADAFFVMMYGRELGIPAMTALKTIHVIDGKPSCSGQALLALMKRGGVEVKVPDPGSVSNSASVQVRRPGGDWKTYTYTMDMARKAGLENKKNWKASPAEMLIWRAVSTAARFEVPDIVGGLYTIEELQPDMPVNEQGELVDTPMITVTTPPPAVEAPAENPENGEAITEAAKSEQSVQAGVPPQNVVDGSAGIDGGDSPNAEAVTELKFNKPTFDFNKVYAAIDYLFEHPKHRNNALLKMMREDDIRPAMVEKAVIEAVLAKYGEQGEAS
jgi:hypothetical protein